MFSIDIAGIAISVFFIITLLSKSHRKKADWLLLLINLNIISLLAVDALFQVKLTPWVFFFLNIVPLFLYPLFLIFALETLQENWHYRAIWVWFFLPALITSVYIGADLFMYHHYNPTQLAELYEHPTLYYHVLCKGFPFLFIGAFIWILKKLNTYALNIKDHYSFIDPIALNWLSNSTWIYIFITLISLIGFLSSQLKVLPISSHFVCNAVGSLLFLAIFYISFHGVHQNSIPEFYGKNAPSEDLPTKEPDAFPDPEIHSPVKYRTSLLNDSERQSIFEKVIQLFEEKELYQEPKLQLSDVAEALQISSHLLSQTINTSAGKPFYDFVNGYRVRHLQKLLEDPSQQKFTILTLGYESGFNSKASLNRVFRQETGLSPSEYLQRIQLNQVSTY